MELSGTVVALSWPAVRRHHGAALPAASQPVGQCLLGFEAQGTGFARLLDAAGIAALYLPAPEIFHGPESLRRLRECWAGDGSPPRGLLHVRFGMVRKARILHGACNVAVVAERRTTGETGLGEHPFADGDVLPAAMRRALTYGQPTALRRSDGTQVPTVALPAFQVNANLAGRTHRPTPGEAVRRGGIQGLEVVSLAEPVAHRRLGGLAPEDCIDFRRLVVHAGDDAPIVLLPWNLAHAGSIVPDVLRKLAPMAHGSCSPRVRG